MPDRRLIMPLPKASFKDDSTYQDASGTITFRNNGGNAIFAMLSGTYKLAPWPGEREAVKAVSVDAVDWANVKTEKPVDFDLIKITGNINGHSVVVFYMDGFDLDPKQPQEGTVKQGETLALGDPSEYLKIKIYVDGKERTPQEAAALIGGISYKEDEEAAKAKSETPDDVMTPGKDESKESDSGFMGLAVKALIAYGVYKYVLKGK